MSIIRLDSSSSSSPITLIIRRRGISPRSHSGASSMAPPAASLGFKAPASSLLSRDKIICIPPRVLALNNYFIRQRRYLPNRRSLSSFFASAAAAAASSHEEEEEDSSKASDIDVEKETEGLKVDARESQEAWQQALASFKERALKMQSVSKEAYEMYSKKAIIILKETSENLKIQSEKAREDLLVVAKEIAEESKAYLATAAENSPEPVKDIVETFASSGDEFNDVSKVRDFYVGIPYGALLSVGGFLSFMLTGSIPAIRFGIILGGTLLALSISSLRSWKKGEPSPLVLKGQTAIATILFLRELRVLFMRPFIANFVVTLISGGVAAFYLYRIRTDRGQSKESNLDIQPEN